VRRFLVVIEDEGSEFDNCDSLEAFLQALFDEVRMPGAVKAVRPGGLLAMKVLDELPRVRHAQMGRPRG
jgi:hypothetical protein